MATHKQNLSKLSINQLSLVTGKAYNTVKRLLGGLDPSSKDGRTLYYSTPDALAKIYGKKTEPESDRLDRLRADQVEFDLSIKRGEYLPADDVQIVLNEAMVIISSNEDAIPGRLAQQLANMTDAAQIRKLLLKELRRGRSSAADRIVEYATGAARSKP